MLGHQKIDNKRASSMIQSCGRRKKPKQKEKTGSSSTWRMSNLREIVENLINQYQSSCLSDIFFST